MKNDPTATEIAAYIGMKIAAFASYTIILLAPLAFWIMTP